MELRNVLLSGAAAWLLAGALPASVRDYPLDEHTVYSIRIGTAEPTTCVFPGPIAALEAANLSARPEDAPPVLLAHQAGTNYFSVRALKEEAKAAANVVIGGRVYALRFIAGEDPDRTVTFQDDASAAAGDAQRILLQRARRLDHASALHPELSQVVQQARPGTVTVYRNFRAVTEAVFRFDADDALIFRVRLQNEGPSSLTYDPEGLAVRIGREVFPAGVAEASGVIPAGGTAIAWFVVAGTPAGGRNDLPVNLPFNVIVPLTP